MERLRWAGNVAHQGVMQNYSLRTREEQTPGIGRKIILKLILKKEGGLDSCGREQRRVLMITIMKLRVQ
jgi:hypothetical protein